MINNYNFNKSFYQNVQSSRLQAGMGNNNNFSMEMLRPLLDMDEQIDYDEIFNEFSEAILKKAVYNLGRTDTISNFSTSEDEEESDP